MWMNGRQEVEQSNKMATRKTMGQQGGRKKASGKYWENSDGHMGTGEVRLLQRSIFGHLQAYSLNSKWLSWAQATSSIIKTSVMFMRYHVFLKREQVFFIKFQIKTRFVEAFQEFTLFNQKASHYHTASMSSGKSPSTTSSGILESVSPIISKVHCSTPLIFYSLHIYSA